MVDDLSFACCLNNKYVLRTPSLLTLFLTHVPYPAKAAVLSSGSFRCSWSVSRGAKSA